MPQPNLVPVRPSVSRNTHSMGMSGATSIVRERPFRKSWMVTPPPQERRNILALPTDNHLMVDRSELFPVEALAENRSGHLTSDQALRFQRMVGARGKSTRGLAVP